MLHDVAAQLPHLLEVSRDAILVRRPGGEILYWNQGAQRLYGYSAEEAVGRHAQELLRAEYPEALLPIDEALARDGQWEGVLRHRRRDGTIVVVGSRWVARDDGAGGRLVLEINRDEAARHTAEHALRLTHDRLEFIANAVEIGVWSCDLPFSELIWNARCKAHFGLPPDAVVTIDTFYERMHPDDVEPTRKAIETAIAEHTTYDCEYRTRQAHGGYRWIRALGRADYDDEGGPIRFDGVTIDVTEERRAAAMLRESEAHFREMADNAPTVLWVTGAAGLCTYLSKQWYEITGGTPEHDLGLGWLESVHPDDLAHAREVFMGANARQVPFSVDYRLRHSGGDYRWVVDSGMPRFGEDGSFLGFVGVVIDVHERKMFERALAETDRRKDEFLATLAHELRNPMAPLVTALRLLEVSEDPATAARARAIMGRQLQQLTKLIDDLLDVSRITRGKLQLRPERITINSVLQSAVEASATLIEARGHRLTVALPDAPIAVSGDPTRLAQVFLNLLNNAAKYTPDGGDIYVSARVEQGEATVEVADTGIGIAPETLPHVFDMFVQAEESRELAQGGLGIGLTLVSRLVELHGGTVHASSEGRGRGSTFTVRLPALPAAVPVLEEGDEGGVVVAAKPRRVLVADDNADAMETLTLLLTRMGHDVRAAADGVEALEVGDAFQPEVVFLDIGMPRMNGYEAARRMRQRPWGEAALIVALTGWGQAHDRERSRAAGIDLHFSKPVDLPVLEACLHGAGVESSPR